MRMKQQIPEKKKNRICEGTEQIRRNNLKKLHMIIEKMWENVV